MHLKASRVKRLDKLAYLHSLSRSVVSLKRYHNRNAKLLALPLEHGNLRHQFLHLLPVLIFPHRLCQVKLL